MFPWLTAFVLSLVVSGTYGEVALTSMEKPAWKQPGCHRIGHSQTLVVPGCAPLFVTTNACRGFCESWAFPSNGKALQPVTSLGQCCSIMDSEDVLIDLPCVEGKRTITLKSATSCSCYHCRKA